MMLNYEAAGAGTTSNTNHMNAECCRKGGDSDLSDVMPKKAYWGMN